MAIPQGFIHDLINRADVVEVVGRHVQLKKAGANYQGLCPFHAEKSPSFSVSPAKQFYHCFGCGKNGNAIGFLMEHLGLNFVEAVQDLAGQYGMAVPQEERTQEEQARAKQLKATQTTLHDVLEKAAKAYQDQLKTSPKAIDYLKTRGLSGEIAKRFELGYAAPGWHGLASVFPDYDDAKLVQSGLVIVPEDDSSTPSNEARRRYDRFRDRVMFPIRNIQGQCIGFGGRVLGDEKPKYLNSPETAVFSKGQELYGLFEARSAIREHNFALVTEGYMDVVALAQLGFPNAVATLGTACTADHVRKLFRFTPHVVFSFDGDAAGVRAAQKALLCAIPFATDERTVRFLFLPKEHDPDSFIREQGNQAFSLAIEQATPLSQMLIDVAREGCNLDIAEGRALFVTQALPLWHDLPTGSLKQQLLREFAKLSDLSIQELLDIWQYKQKQQNARSKPAMRGQNTADANPYRPTSGSPKSRGFDSSSNFSTPWVQRSGRSMAKTVAHRREDQLLRLLLCHPQFWHDLSDDEHTFLCNLPMPHGPVLAWLETQLIAHPHLNMATLWQTVQTTQQSATDTSTASDTNAAVLSQVVYFLQQGLTQQSQPANAASATNLLTDEETQEAREEMLDILRRMYKEYLVTQKNAALLAIKDDPTALKRYQILQKQWEALSSTPVKHP